MAVLAGSVLPSFVFVGAPFSYGSRGHSIPTCPSVAPVHTRLQSARPRTPHAPLAVSFVCDDADNHPSTPVSALEQTSHDVADVFAPGDLLADRYRVVRALGKGASSVTYDAVDTHHATPLEDPTPSSTWGTRRHPIPESGTPAPSSLAVDVVLKALTLRNMRSWKSLDLFQREVRALQALAHPAIPKYVDAFEVDLQTDRVFVLVQRKATGTSLQDLIDNGFRFTPAQLKALLSQLLDILGYLGSQSPPVLHRDVKPANVIVDSTGSDMGVSLVDFGAVNSGVTTGPLPATATDTALRPGSSASRVAPFASTVVGTFGYMAPEQFSGAADVRSDLYATGATLLHAISGCAPSEVRQIRLKLDIDSVVDRAQRRELGRVYTVMKRLLEPAPEDRYQTAVAALSALCGRPAPAGTGHRTPSSNFGGWMARLPSPQPGYDAEYSDSDDDELISGLRFKPISSYYDQASAAMQAALTAVGGPVVRHRTRRPAGTRVLLEWMGGSDDNRGDAADGLLLRVYIPPRGMTARAASDGAAVAMWTGGVALWTAGAVTGGAPILFTLFSLPFWYRAAKLAKGAVDGVRASAELVISGGGNGRSRHGADGVFSLRIVDGFGREMCASGDVADLDAAELDVTAVEGDVPCATRIVLREGIRTHAFGEELDVSEQRWICGEVNAFLDRVR